jgi:hypothetical protein
MSIPGLEERIARARELMRPYQTREGLIGIFLYGSSCRPYADANSDYDIRIIVEDEALKTIPVEEIHTNFSEGGKKLGDVWITSRTEFENRKRDIDHFRARHARILFDPTGAVASMLERAAVLPSAIRDVRLRVHYYEFTYLSQKVQNAHRRAKRIPALLCGSQLVYAVAKLLLIEKGEWPAPMTWVFEELELAGIPAEIITDLRRVLETADVRAVRALRGRLDPYLIERGNSFIEDPTDFWHWLFHTAEGERAEAEWAGDGFYG